MTTATETKTLHGVFYSDGGARPNPGFAGWGVHGYLYDKNKEVKNPGKHNAPTIKGYVENLIDQATQGKAVKIESYIDGWGSHPSATNNEMELTAFQKTLEFIRDNEIEKSRLYLDSQYVIQGYTKQYDVWEQNGWKTSQGKTPLNLDKWHEIKYLANEIESKGYSFKLDWVKGHIGLLGNSRADELATRGVFTAQNKIDYEEMVISPVANYNTPSVDINSLITRNRWYFITGYDDPEQFFDGRWLYYTGYHGKPKASKDDEEEHDEGGTFSEYRPPDSINWGVSQPDTYYGLVLVKDRIDVIDSIQRLHNLRCPDDHERLVVGNLANILNSKTFNLIKEHGDKVLTKHQYMNQLSNTSGQYVTWEIKPQRRAYLAHETFESYKQRLIDYVNGKMNVTDITDLIYETVEKKKKVSYKVKDTIPQTCKFLDLEVNVDLGKGVEKQPLRLTLNIDFPVRNHLMRMTEDGTVKPKVEIVTWRESDVAFRYGAIIERNGDLLFWVGSDANLRIVHQK